MRLSVLSKVTVAACCMLLSGCAYVRHQAVPESLTDRVSVMHMPQARFIAGGDKALFKKGLLESLEQERRADFPLDASGVKIYSVLAISGGAANGAYGSGLLKGWSETGTRPVFKVVTGISTGAIMAPFAFLGSRYDRYLEKLYTGMTTRSVMRSRNIFSLLFGDSLATNAPLEQTLKRAITPEIVEDVAKEHAAGRRLYVGTVNLDLQKMVVWDMGMIAAVGTPEAFELFRKIIIASTAIPITFPPVYFTVQDEGGKAYDEMHVDGGTITQVFYLFDLTKFMQDALALSKDSPQAKFRLYVIRNGHMASHWQETKGRLDSISMRALDTMINAQAFGDVLRLYQYAKKTGSDFNLAYIPEDFVPRAKEMFDPKEMQLLFFRGYRDVIDGTVWHKSPPGWEEK